MEPEIQVYKWQTMKSDNFRYGMFGTYNNTVYSFQAIANKTAYFKFNNLFKMDMKKQLWIKISSKGTSPTPRCGSVSVVYKTSMFVFGGCEYGSGKSANDLFEYQFTRNTWQQWVIEGVYPDPRHKHCAIVHDDRLWIWGGKCVTDFYDMWTISLIEGSSPKWEKVVQKVDSLIKATESAVTLVNNNMFIVTMVENNLSKLLKFSFQNRSWLCLKDVFELDRPILIRKSYHRLFVFDGEFQLYSYDLNTQILSVHESARNLISPPVRVLNDYMVSYNSDKGERFELQIVRNYPNCTLSADFRHLLSNQLFDDVDFLVGELEIKVS